MKDKDKEVIEAEFQDPNRSTGKTLEIDEQVENIPEAEKLAKKKLRDANKDAVTASIGMQGDFRLMAGVLIQLKGYGKFDGKYIITRANHDISESYRTNIEMRQCLSGY
jgi:phage protein D